MAIEGQKRTGPWSSGSTRKSQMPDAMTLDTLSGPGSGQGAIQAVRGAAAGSPGGALRADGEEGGGCIKT
eukprot:2041325-Pyramimonas_sp.AAC.1